jgi:hypothetical protein
MKSKIVLIAIAFIFISSSSLALNMRSPYAGNFDVDKDLLLAHFDCKTDVDDLQTVAALVTLMSDNEYSEINYHAVAGAYGIQEGLYVPPNDLFKLAFGDNWTDAHENVKNAVDQVKVIAEATLRNQGDIWIAEAGQSDFSAKLIKAIKADLPDIDISQRIHIVQHSDWNEEVTSAVYLDFVKKNIDYQKIPDGNAVGNGTPGFRSPEYTNWKDKFRDPKLIEVWQLAIDLSNRYNGKEGRYNNEAISAGGLDFSDLSEVCWILGLEDIRDTEHFFNLYAK